jgi:two-component system cell cycle sensor histidine kinase/response regulator CckA
MCGYQKARQAKKMATKPPGKEKFKAPLNGTSKNARPPSSRVLYLVMALVAVVILGGGYLFYHFQEQQMRQRVEGGLSIVAQLKAEQIVEWRADRLMDADVLVESPFFTEGVEKYLASTTDAEAKDKILARLAIIAKYYSYQDILLTDVNGKVLLNLNDSVHRLSDVTLAQLPVAIKEHKAVMVDFHYLPDGNSPNLDVVAPLFPWGLDSQLAIGAVVFCIDPSQYLYPLVQSLPMPSETAEILLVERDGDQVLFLNELRYQKDTALKLRIPLSQQEVPAVMAVLGKEGIIEGRDYRGVEVLAVLKHIPDSPWYIVAKIDNSEALSVLRSRAGFTVASVVGLLAAALALVGLIWQRRRRLVYQALYQAELETQALRSHFEYLVKYANDIIFLTDEDYHIVEVNDRALEAYGYTRGEMLGMPLASLVAPEDRPSYQTRLRKIQQKGAIVAEAIHQRKDGSTFHVEVSGRTIKIGDKTYFQGIARDITERKQAEEKVLKQSAILRAINRVLRETLRCETDEEVARTCLTIAQRLTGSKFGWIGEVNSSGRLDTIALSNPGWDSCRIPGTKAALMINNMEIRGIWGRVLKDGKSLITNDPTNHPNRVGLPNGHPKLTAFLGVPLKRTGKTIGMIALANKPLGYELQDQEAIEILSVALVEALNRKQSEETLRQSEEKYRTILKEIADSYFEVDLAGNLTFVNDATCRNLGYSRKELLGMNYRDFTAGEDIEHVYQTFNEVYRTGKPNKGFLWKVIRKDGSTGFADASISLLRSQEGEIIGFRGVGRDITERKMAEEERIQLELKAQITSRLASVGEMAAGVAHEINNPLTAVTGYAQLLVGREDIPSDIRSDLEAINDGARRVAGIVRTLLAFSRQTKPQRKLVDINELIESTLILRAYHLRVNNIEVVTRLAPDVLETVVDPGQIQQVLLNLIVNAETEMKLAHGKGKLTITTKKSDNTIKICCQDNGPGIKPEVMDKIFDPFFTTREVGQGTGLGLSLCYGIVTEHKGKIYAESQPGKGATFIIELPIVTEVAPPKPAEPVVKKTQKAGKARILVVDDEQVVRDVVNRVLTGEGYKVETVDNAADALKKIESKKYNLILVDIKMPGMNGVELYKRIQKIAKPLVRRVVFITGDIMGADTEKFLSETKVAHIEKPFDAEQLIREVKRTLTASR